MIGKRAAALAVLVVAAPLLGPGAGVRAESLPTGWDRAAETVSRLAAFAVTPCGPEGWLVYGHDRQGDRIGLHHLRLVPEPPGPGVRAELQFLTDRHLPDLTTACDTEGRWMVHQVYTPERRVEITLRDLRDGRVVVAGTGLAQLMPAPDLKRVYVAPLPGVEPPRRAPGVHLLPAAEGLLGDLPVVGPELRIPGAAGPTRFSPATDLRRALLRKSLLAADEDIDPDRIAWLDTEQLVIAGGEVEDGRSALLALVRLPGDGEPEVKPLSVQFANPAAGAVSYFDIGDVIDNEVAVTVFRSAGQEVQLCGLGAEGSTCRAVAAAALRCRVGTRCRAADPGAVLAFVKPAEGEPCLARITTFPKVSTERAERWCPAKRELFYDVPLSQAMLAGTWADPPDTAAVIGRHPYFKAMPVDPQHVFYIRLGLKALPAGLRLRTKS